MTTKHINHDLYLREMTAAVKTHGITVVNIANHTALDEGAISLETFLAVARVLVDIRLANVEVDG